MLIMYRVLILYFVLIYRMLIYRMLIIYRVFIYRMLIAYRVLVDICSSYRGCSYTGYSLYEAA
jgi:hypothetical protein